MLKFKCLITEQYRLLVVEKVFGSRGTLTHSTRHPICPDRWITALVRAEEGSLDFPSEARRDCIADDVGYRSRRVIFLP